MTVPASGPGDTFTTGDATPNGSGAHPPNPLLAALGAGDAAVAAVAKAFADALGTAASTRETVQQRVADLPAELEGLRGRFSGEELRRALEAYRAQVERAYAEFAGRGEATWGRLREQPQVRTAVTTFEAYSDKLDARVDDAQEAASRALAAAQRQTRATGDRVARAGQRFSGRAADAVVDASATAAEAVADVGTTAAEVIEEAGGETATATRKATGASSPRSTTPRRTPRRSGPASS